MGRFTVSEGIGVILFLVSVLVIGGILDITSRSAFVRWGSKVFLGIAFGIVLFYVFVWKKVR